MESLSTPVTVLLFVCAVLVAFWLCIVLWMVRTFLAAMRDAGRAQKRDLEEFLRRSHANRRRK